MFNKSQSTPGAYFLQKLREHFQTDPAKLTVVTQRYAQYDRANIHLAFESLAREAGHSAELEGIISNETWESPSLAKLSRESTSKKFLSGPVEYRDVEIADGKRLACTTEGIYWIRHQSTPAVMLVTEGRQQYPPRIHLQVMAVNQDAAQDLARKFAALVQQSPAFRGQVISLETDCHREMQVRFHSLPKIKPDDLVLPPKVLERLNRQAIGFVRHAARLRHAGRHLKRGVLLHGPPGTGKTLSAMYLASLMPGRTVMILTGGGMNSIEACGSLARALAPVTVILEDVDLIGTMREHQSVSANALLFELLNQMDGLSEDADVLFVLTTNRPDVLEPALASRPGRIDQAIEVPMPDDHCRHRLLNLYAKGIDLRLTDRDGVVSRTQGVSAAFIRELLRRATILSAEESTEANDDSIIVTDEHVAAAFEELTQAGGRLTQTLLGIEHLSGTSE